MAGKMIVLSGLAGAGKDSVAEILCMKHGFVRFMLSGEMKAFCEKVFGWSEEQLYGPSKFRNAADPAWARPCKECDGTGWWMGQYEEPIQSCCTVCGGDGKLDDNSPRRVLQLLGDEWGRQMIHPDIWTMSARKNLTQLLTYHDVVVTDARFQNDRNNLHEWFGAARVHVVAPGAGGTEGWRKHGSEREQPNADEVEVTVTNEEAWPFPSLVSKVASVHEFVTKVSQRRS